MTATAASARSTRRRWVGSRRRRWRKAARARHTRQPSAARAAVAAAASSASSSREFKQLEELMGALKLDEKRKLRERLTEMIEVELGTSSASVKREDEAMMVSSAPERGG